jgi:hypothetical protein
MSYKIGDCVTFRDPNGNVCHGKDSLSRGIVNGEPMVNLSTELRDVFCAEAVTYVPLWCERDRGREAATVYVDSRNILGGSANGPATL